MYRNHRRKKSMQCILESELLASFIMSPVCRNINSTKRGLPINSLENDRDNIIESYHMLDYTHNPRQNQNYFISQK